MPETRPADPIRVYLGVGSNLQPRRHVPAALAGLDGIVAVDGVAPCWWSAPLGRPEQPRYLNTVFTGLTPLSPRDLRDRLRELEARLGRRRSADRYASRTLDLDILLYGDRVIAQGALRIPDPDLRTRAFVARPLAALAPELRLPDTGERVADLAAALPEGELVPAPRITAALQAALHGPIGP